MKSKLKCNSCNNMAMSYEGILYAYIYINGKKKPCIAKIFITQKYAADEHEKLQS